MSRQSETMIYVFFLIKFLLYKLEENSIFYSVFYSSITDEWMFWPKPLSTSFKAKSKRDFFNTIVYPYNYHYDNLKRIKFTLCGTHPPWIEKIKHLGITVTDNIDSFQPDIVLKRAKYIESRIEINQEFYCVTPKSRWSYIADK